MSSSFFCFSFDCLVSLESECPPNSTIEPCFCIPDIPYDIFPPHYELRPQITAIHGKSIVCENIDNSSFDLRSVFLRLSSILADDTSRNQTHFDGFFLHNTLIRHLPENVSDQLTFSGVIFHKNPLLTSIDANAFAGTREYLEVFQTFNTNLSETSGLFPALRTLINLRMVSMHDDQLQSIPDYAFNHTRLTEIWLGLEIVKAEDLEDVFALPGSNQQICFCSTQSIHHRCGRSLSNAVYSNR